MKVLVIGASSFIGVYTIQELLDNGHTVTGTGRSPRFKAYYEKLGVPYIRLDLKDSDDIYQLAGQQFDCIILLSSLLPANSTVDLNEQENAEDYIQTNTISMCRILEFCRQENIPRVIFTTSFADVSAYYKKDVAILDDVPRSFSHAGDHAAYIISKNAACDLLEYYNEQHGMKNVIFRLPPVYGVGPHGGLFDNGTYRKSGLLIFMDKAAAGEDIEVYGDGSISRDVVYVKDVAQAMEKATTSKEAHGIYNITSGRAVTLEEQANVIAKVFTTGKESKVNLHPEMENTGASYLFSIEKAKRDFGYLPKYAEFMTMMKDYKSVQDAGKMSALF